MQSLIHEVVECCRATELMQDQIMLDCSGHSLSPRLMFKPWSLLLCFFNFYANGNCPALCFAASCLANSPLGVLVTPSAVHHSASWSCPRRFAARRLGLALGLSPLASPRCLKRVPIVPISVRCTNQRTLVHPCQNNPRQPLAASRIVPIVRKKQFFLQDLNPQSPTRRNGVKTDLRQ